MSKGRSQPKVLFVEHAASRNGATILLLNFLEWLRSNSEIDFEIVSYGVGPLIEAFRAVAPTRVMRGSLQPSRYLKDGHIRDQALQLERSMLRRRVSTDRYDLVYVNTVAAWRHVAALAGTSTPVLWHVHELAYAIGRSMPLNAARSLLPGVSRLIAVSHAVKNELTETFAVPSAGIDVVNGFVSQEAVSSSERQRLRSVARAELGWSEDAFVVGGCGGLGWRKGSDVFLQVAKSVVQYGRTANARFLWVGGGDSRDLEVIQFMHDMRALGLDGLCTQVQTSDDILRYYCAMDAFALTSREDPYPLVMLEAGLQSVPTVCFADAGGAAEFVCEDAGIVVPYLDVSSFGHALLSLQLSPDVRSRLGTVARRKVLDSHRIDTQGPLMLESIRRAMDTHRSN